MICLLSDLHLLYNLIQNALDWLFVNPIDEISSCFSGHGDTFSDNSIDNTLGSGSGRTIASERQVTALAMVYIGGSVTCSKTHGA